MRRIPWQLLAAAALLVLLATLATFQYRWLGDVSEAERERMRTTLRTRASEFAQEFDGELTRMYVTFRVDGDRLDADAGATLADAYARWQSSTAAPDLVRAVYIVQGNTTDGLRRYDLDRHTLEAVAWPTELWALRDSAGHMPAIPGLRSPFFMADAVDSRVPALVVGIPKLRRIEVGQTLTVLPDPTAQGSAIIVVLDRDRLQRHLLEPLVTKYFGAPTESGYLVTVVRRDDSQVIFPSNVERPLIDGSNADVATGLFDLRLEEINRLTTHGRDGTLRDRVFTIVRRANGPDGKRVLMAGGDGQGMWEVRVRHRAGSLESIVERSRRRNLAISLGVLSLLGASFVLVIASARRQRRLARQQMEFVAAVSHELRTPLAVIRSAGENLADGVVADGPQVKKYGALIETEGRRLTSMVERVMDFAGITSGAAPRVDGEVDVATLIADVVRDLEAEARDRGVTFAVRTDGAPRRVMGDRDALRSAIQNIVGNAVKYSASGATVDVSAENAGAVVRLTVVDRGLGIDDEDLPHIFKPFYRGRRALDAQVRGSGVGLSVVRHVVDAHKARIDVSSRAGEGTTVTVELPAIQSVEGTEIAEGDAGDGPPSRSALRRFAD